MQERCATVGHALSPSSVAAKQQGAQVDPIDTTAVEAAAFRRLRDHLMQERPDVQNIDLMILAGFCRNCLADWYRELETNSGMADNLASYATLGDWRWLQTMPERFNLLLPEDLQRVARTYFSEANSTVAELRSIKSDSAQALADGSREP